MEDKGQRTRDKLQRARDRGQRNGTKENRKQKTGKYRGKKEPLKLDIKATDCNELSLFLPKNLLRQTVLVKLKKKNKKKENI